MERAKTATGLQEIRHSAQKRDTLPKLWSIKEKPNRDASESKEILTLTHGAVLGDIFQLCRPMASSELDHFLQYLWSDEGGLCS